MVPTASTTHQNAGMLALKTLLEQQLMQVEMIRKHEHDLQMAQMYNK